MRVGCAVDVDFVPDIPGDLPFTVILLLMQLCGCNVVETFFAIAGVLNQPHG